MLGARSMQLFFSWRHAVFNEECVLISAKDITCLSLLNRVLNPPPMSNVAGKGKIHRCDIPCSKQWKIIKHEGIPIDI